MISGRKKCCVSAGCSTNVFKPCGEAVAGGGPVGFEAGVGFGEGGRAAESPFGGVGAVFDDGGVAGGAEIGFAG